MRLPFTRLIEYRYAFRVLLNQKSITIKCFVRELTFDVSNLKKYCIDKDNTIHTFNTLNIQCEEMFTFFNIDDCFIEIIQLENKLELKSITHLDASKKISVTTEDNFNLYLESNYYASW